MRIGRVHIIARTVRNTLITIALAVLVAGFIVWATTEKTIPWWVSTPLSIIAGTVLGIAVVHVWRKE